MKQYLIDELRPQDYETIKAYLDECYGSPDIGGIYWVPLAEGILSPVQEAHSDCHPFCFAMELEAHQLSCELLVRTRHKVRCDCIRYATTDQRNWFIDLVDGILEQLKIIT